jgi:THO complex subunit 4
VARRRWCSFPSLPLFLNFPPDSPRTPTSPFRSAQQQSGVVANGGKKGGDLRTLLGPGNITKPGVNKDRALSTGIKMLVTNLDGGVTLEDMQELFKDYGIKKVEKKAIGIFEVVFFRRTDALAAHREFHQVKLDGKPLRHDICCSLAPF